MHKRSSSHIKHINARINILHHSVSTVYTHKAHCAQAIAGNLANPGLLQVGGDGRAEKHHLPYLYRDTENNNGNKNVLAHVAKIAPLRGRKANYQAR